MFYESLIILNISTLNFSEGVPASVVGGQYKIHSWSREQRVGSTLFLWDINKQKVVRASNGDFPM